MAVGDAVFGLGMATMAEYAVLTSWAHKPDSLSFEEASGLPVVVETTTRIFDQVVAKPGETILVSGASGGVGTVLIQFARHRGMTVIGTASDRNQDYVRKLGAIPTPYGPGLADRVAQLAPQGVDAAFDIAGSGIIAELVDIVGNPVRVLSISDFSAPNYGAQFSPDPRQSPGRHLAEAARLHSEGGLRLTVEKTFPLARIGEAQALSSEGHVTGKLVVTVT